MSVTIPVPPLGKQGLTASILGLGCMGMAAFYGETDDAKCRNAPALTEQGASCRN